MAEIKDLINKVNKVGYDGLNDSEYATLKALPKAQRDIVNKVNKGTFDALNDSEYAAIKSFVVPAPKAEPDDASGVGSFANMLRTFFPETSTNVESGAASKFPLWSGIRDAATLVPRAAAGVGAALGEYGPHMGGLPDVKAFREAVRVGAEAMRDPSASAAEAPATSKVGRVLQGAAAEAASDPTTLPLTMIGGGPNLPVTLVRGAGMGAGTYATHALDRYARDQDDVLTGETLGQIIQDVTPVVAPALFRLGGEFLKAGVGPLVENFGEAGVKHAQDMVRRMVKPPPQPQGGQVTKGFVEGLASDFKGKPMFEHLVDYGTQTVPDIQANFERLRPLATSGFDPALAALDQTGVRVPRDEVIRAARTGMIQDAAAGEGMDMTARRRAEKFVRDMLSNNEEPKMLEYQDRLRVALEQGGREATPSAYRVVSLPSAQEIAAKLKGLTPAEKTEALANMHTIQELTPQQYKAQIAAGKISEVGATGREPALKYVAGTHTVPLYNTPKGMMPQSQALYLGPLSPRTAQTLKSTLMREAFKRSENPETAKESAALYAGSSLRDWLTKPVKELTQPGQVRLGTAMPFEADTPAQLAAKADFAKVLSESAPFYKMEAAMSRNAPANRYGLSLLKAASGLNHELRAWAQESPAMARAAYDYGKATAGLRKTVGDFLTKPMSDNTKLSIPGALHAATAGLHKRTVLPAVAATAPKVAEVSQWLLPLLDAKTGGVASTALFRHAFPDTLRFSKAMPYELRRRDVDTAKSKPDTAKKGK